MGFDQRSSVWDGRDPTIHESIKKKSRERENAYLRNDSLQYSRPVQVMTPVTARRVDQ